MQMPVETMHHRALDEEAPEGEPWEKAYTVIVIFLMFAVLVTDRVGADWVMLTVLTAFMVAEIISVKEGIAGFANTGVLTVMVLFVVAEGISKTGALDWYLGKLLGSPKSSASAQMRLMIPVTIVSAFLNNTPIVVVMIPIVNRWARNSRISSKQLLIPLSFASIFGGTCTLIGTSTNLVVEGLYSEKYPDAPPMTLFDVGKYGVPVAMAGIAYMLLASPILLPGGRSGNDDNDGDSGDILLSARLTKFSPAAGRTVHRSGLRDSGGIFLVSVLRAATGNIHRAVSRDFVLNVGDILYFTGLIEGFGHFCEEHGLEMITNEVEGTLLVDAVHKQEESMDDSPEIHVEVGVSKESLLHSDADERLRVINRMVDLIHGVESADPSQTAGPAQIVVTIEQDLVVVGISVRDRAGLLLDISKGLLRLNMQIHNTQAAVLNGRSVSVWRCVTKGSDLADLEEIWSVMSALLSDDDGVEAIKHRGLIVIRARVLKDSRLVSKTATESNFRAVYKAAIVSVVRGGRSITSKMSEVRFEVGDVLVLQTNDDSPLLMKPPTDFHEVLDGKSGRAGRSSANMRSFVDMISGRQRDSNASGSAQIDVEPIADGSNDESDGAQVATGVWKDLEVLSKDPTKEGEKSSREFLTAVTVVPKAKLIGSSAAQLSLNKLPDLVLVSIERVVPDGSHHTNEDTIAIASGGADVASLEERSDGGVKQVFVSITEDDPLKESDILWYSGPAAAIGDLRKIPGLVMFENEEVQKINEHVHNRRLIQAVVGRNSPLVGKTVKESQFRTKYGAAVLSVQREGKRVHEHPGRVKLQAGDVLLLEAGPAFIAKRAQNDRTFALLAEVKDSAPPRLRLLIPALIITAGMVAVFVSGLTTILIAALVAGILMVCLGILSEQEARDSINWDIYITIASAFGIGTALVNSGVAGAIANFLVDVGAAIGIGEAGLYGSVYFATFLISNVVTNNAAAALIFPVAVEAADQAGADRLIMCYAVMLGASASFLSPFGYTTNLLVYAEGGYTFKDFFVVGTPLQIVLWILSTAYLSLIEPWYVSWIGTGVVLFAVIMFRLESWSVIGRLFAK